VAAKADSQIEMAIRRFLQPVHRLPEIRQVSARVEQTGGFESFFHLCAGSFERVLQFKVGGDEREQGFGKLFVEIFNRTADAARRGESVVLTIGDSTTNWIAGACGSVVWADIATPQCRVHTGILNKPACTIIDFR